MLQWLPLQERHISHLFCRVDFEDISKCQCSLSFNFVNLGQNILAISGQHPLWFWHGRSSRWIIWLANGQDASGLRPCKCLTDKCWADLPSQASSCWLELLPAPLVLNNLTTLLSLAYWCIIKT